MPGPNASASAAAEPRRHAGAGAVGASEFATLMNAVGPFEARPHVAVAVSGGPDSLALALLAARWAKQRRGRVLALTVDHGLRPDSKTEARRVGDWLERRGIDHRILSWSGDKPASNVQAAARAARYRLLDDACRRAGVLHLLLGHHREDQVETFLLRLGRGSGLAGLAAMAAIAESRSVRLLRPLLPVPKDRLAATLRRAGQSWIEDPSNADPAFARARLRAGMAEFEALGLDAARVAETAARLGVARAESERETAAALADLAVVDGRGFATVDRGGLMALAPDRARRVLHALVTTIGATAYGPRGERLLGLLAALRGGGRVARTLGGCRILAGERDVMIAREVGTNSPVRLDGSREVSWDGRFRLRFRGVAAARCAGQWLDYLGTGGWSAVAREVGPAGCRGLPAAVRPALPALSDGTGIRLVPHLGYGREAQDIDTLKLLQVDFEPARTLTGAVFQVAVLPPHPIS